MTHTTTDEVICQIIRRAAPKSTLTAGVTPSTYLKRDLGLDSIGLLSVVYAIDESISIDAFDYVQEFIVADTVSDIIRIVRQAQAP